ncbi:MAG: DUF1351 domain-containing protein [Clostridium sp.]|uniref:DUF1351 domain-containing protein n=1 Tax=Clostridium sp. TaxID=1506 RepID=UPI003D6CACFC
MKELALVSQTTPAVVTFNYTEIDAQLDVTLKKYSGLVFTEDTVKECKKTITELRKGKKSLNDFKIKTKALLTEDITKFEEQCKKLSDKFDTVIDPINIQADAFEVTRIANKRAEIQTIINTLTDERFLEYKYYSQLVITEQMLNKGPKIKDITVDLTKQADILLSLQNVEEANIELIKSKVELANSQYGVTLLNNLYLSLLSDGEDVNSLIKMINENAEQTKIKAEEAEAEKLEIEARKVERAAKLEEDKKIYKERQDALNARRSSDVTAWEAIEKSKVVTPSPRSVETREEAEVMATETYTVTGTEAQLDALEEYLNVNGYVWI